MAVVEIEGKAIRTRINKIRPLLFIRYPLGWFRWFYLFKPFHFHSLSVPYKIPSHPSHAVPKDRFGLDQSIGGRVLSGSIPDDNEIVFLHLTAIIHPHSLLEKERGYEVKEDFLRFGEERSGRNPIVKNEVFS
jgi:hypothetical protein